MNAKIIQEKNSWKYFLSIEIHNYVKITDEEVFTELPHTGKSKNTSQTIWYIKLQFHKCNCSYFLGLRKERFSPEPTSSRHQNT